MTDGKGRAIMAHGRILFINASQKRDGNTVEYAQALLDGLDFERIDLVDYRMGFFGQDFADDQFEEVFQKMVESDTIVLGSPVYSETMSAAARLLLERLETRPQDDALAGRRFAFFIQSYGPKPLTVESAVASVENVVAPLGMRLIGTASDMVEPAELREALESAG